MAVTIQMIGEKEFKIKAHGYDQDEVDEFLDEIADEFEEMEHKINELSARLAEAQEEAERAASQPQPQVQAVASAQPARPESNYASQEENIRNMIINTQRVCDETLANAQERAQEMERDAREQADRIRADAQAETQQLEDEMAVLRAGAQDFRARFQQLIDNQSQLLRAEGDLFKKK
ncbi:MAG: DivIVA domain-containing protein [Clostridia bacterium]|nr:DivIVA domain-containing protein [Clostridia bacterium]